MEQTEPRTKTAEQIIAKIKGARIRMRPKWHFVLEAVLYIVGTVIVFLLALYLASFISFIVSESRLYVTPQFGIWGLYVFLTSLPWLLIVLALVFMVILELLVRQYAFAYRRPLMYSLLGILCIVFAGSIIVNRTEFHLRLMRFADQRRLPIASPLYRGFGRPDFRQVHVGQITGFIEEGCTMEDPHGDMISVIISPRTRMPQGVRLIIGDHILVIGERDDDRIRAFGLQKIVPPRW